MILPRKQSLTPAGTALFAAAWVLARAKVQSITIDEADSYLAYAANPNLTHWTASSNNHLLNSMLMRLSVTAFGASELSARAPALLGAALYLWAVWRLARNVARGSAVLEWALVACMAFNPLVMDYLVAARGYSLALGLLMAALALAAGGTERPYRTGAAISLCAALSVTANWSFALADAAVVLLALARMARGRRPGEWLRMAAACVAPGAAAALFLAGSVLATWPRGVLVWGTESLRDTFHGVAEASLYELNPYLVNPPLLAFLERWNWLLFPLAGAILAWRIAAIARARPPLSRLFSSGGWLAAGTLALSLTAHWLLFRTMHLLLPKVRTAVYLVPLLALVAGAAASVPLGSRLGRLSGRALTAALVAIGCHFLLCLRLTYFQEWRWDADVGNVYEVLARYNHRYGLTDIASSWRYAAALNFYRDKSRRETIPRLEPLKPPYPEGHQAYVVYYLQDQPFVEKNGLKVVYVGNVGSAAVAIRPEVEQGRQAP